jgi:hypothetical protein
VYIVFAPHPWYHHSLPLGRTCFVLLLSNFIEEKEIKDNKKNMAFLLV